MQVETQQRNNETGEWEPVIPLPFYYGRKAQLFWEW